MSKAASRLKTMKKSLDKVAHGKMKTNIPAGMAAAGPPLGPMLGQRGINIATFCKDFNEKTKDVIEGVPLPCRVSINPDRSYDLVIHQPPATFFIKQAAGIQRAAMYPGKEVSGKITLKHIYEIAKIKGTDPTLETKSEYELCNMLIGVAHSCGVEVVKEISPVEYNEFLVERKAIEEQQRKELQEKKEAKMLRTT